MKIENLKIGEVIEINGKTAKILKIYPRLKCIKVELPGGSQIHYKIKD